MKLNGTVESLPAFVVFIAAYVLAANLIEHKRNPRPPLAKYRKDGGVHWVGFWNLFDESIFTAEAIEFHRRRLLFVPFALVALVVGWLILDLIW